MLVKKNYKKSTICIIKNNQFRKKVTLKNNTQQSSCLFITKNAFLRNNNIKLKIILACYYPQVKDIYFAINTIEKLIHYLNLLYARLGKLPSTFCSAKLDNFAFCPKQQSCDPVLLNKKTSLAEKEFGCLPSYLENLGKINKEEIKEKEQQTPDFEKAKQNTAQEKFENNVKQLKWYFSRVGRITKKTDSSLKSNINNYKLLEYYNYINRFFFKCSKYFSSTHPMKGRLAQKRSNKQIITVTRAPFVFKKTREQFGLQKLIYRMSITFASPAQKSSLIQNLRLLKLPVEIQLIDK